MFSLLDIINLLKNKNFKKLLKEIGKLVAGFEDKEKLLLIN